MKKLLTVPSPVREDNVVYATGNRLVSASEITPGGDIIALSHIRESLNGLVEYRNEPLLTCLLDGMPLARGSHGYRHDFIPTFSCSNGSLTITRKICAPENIRGFVIHVTLRAQSAISGKIALRCNEARFCRTVFNVRPLSGETECGVDTWTGCAWMERVCGGGLSALALSGGVQSAHGGVLEAERAFSLKAGQTESFCFYVSLGCELDGARLANMDMQRRGEELCEKEFARLDRLHVPLPDKTLEALCNRNLAFCAAFSIGEALDTGRLMLMTSRSGRYYVSGAYWARDCMLWAFPGLLRHDADLAREALLAACTTYLKNGAYHALYLNGTTLYPGFELDQLVAPVIALNRYVSRTGDTGILARGEVAAALGYIAGQLARWRDAGTGLYATELSPSDDPVGCPFLTYDNALVLAALRFLHGKAGDFTDEIAALEKALRTLCVAHTPGGDIFAWACDGQGRQEVYDNPPGGLALLPYYGGADRDDPVWRNTVRHYYSAENPYYTEQGALFGEGCEHAPAPWPMSLCNLILSGVCVEQALHALAVMPMDNTLACETVRPEDGCLHTGAAFATFAGFLANAILEAYEN